MASCLTSCKLLRPNQIVLACLLPPIRPNTASSNSTNIHSVTFVTLTMTKGIHYYAARGDIAGVTAELAQGTPVDYIHPGDKMELTALMAASSSPMAGTDMLQYLISRGANINSFRGFESNLPLQRAIQRSTLEKVLCLVDAGADVHYRRPSGHDAVLDAVYSCRLDRNPHIVTIIDFLLSKGIPGNPVPPTEYGGALRTAAFHARFDVVKRLLDAGAPIDALGWTPLMHAVALGELTEVEYLLTTDHFSQDELDSAWLLSIRADDVNKAQCLLNSGANRNACDCLGRTALMHTLPNKFSTMRWLLAEGVDAEIRDSLKKTVLQIAAYDECPAGVEALLQGGVSPASITDEDFRLLEGTGNCEIRTLLNVYGWTPSS